MGFDSIKSSHSELLSFITILYTIRNNDDWEDRDEEHNIWDEWKTAYKRAHAKLRVKAQATKGLDKFGAANTAGRVLKTSEVDTNNGGNEVGMKSLEGYFDNIAAAKINNKSVLEQLVTNYSKLADTNKDLVAIVKNFQRD